MKTVVTYARSIGLRARCALSFLITLAFLVTIESGVGCGKPNDESQTKEPEISEGGMIPVVGNASFGSQCPYGSITNPRPATVGVWDCPVGLKKVELAEPPPALILQADCKKRILTVRSADQRIDTAWEVMPDGTFSVTLDNLQLRLQSDGSGNSGCTAHLSTDLWGSLQCSDRDKVDIKFDTIWWLSKGARPSPTPGIARADSATECRMPQTCYMHTSLTIKQCE
jgi:hypothetical protein